MITFHTVVLVLFVLAGLALFVWGVRSFGLPAPIPAIVIVIACLLVLYFLYQQLAGVHGH
jgi:hypothetical protein